VVRLLLDKASSCPRNFFVIQVPAGFVCQFRTAARQLDVGPDATDWSLSRLQGPSL
jgi:hypothetical protein